MRAAIGVLLLIVAIAYVAEALDASPINGAYDYHRKFGIPQAQKIKELEDGIASGQRVAGGSTTTTLSVPYQVGLMMTVLIFTSICGGALISQNTVLTAAHCFNDGVIIASSTTVVLGSNFLFSGGIRLSDVTVTSHPDYVPQLVLNDISVVRIPSVKFSLTLQAIDTPLSSSELSNNWAGYTALASGYGITNDGDSVGLLQMISSVNLQVMTNEECARIYPGIIQNTHLCTSGVGGVGVCAGDTGGPLVVSTGWTRRVLIGISSFLSANGCTAGFPSGFTRVTPFLGWIYSV